MYNKSVQKHACKAVGYCCARQLTIVALNTTWVHFYNHEPKKKKNCNIYSLTHWQHGLNLKKKKKKRSRKGNACCKVQNSFAIFLEKGCLEDILKSSFAQKTKKYLSQQMRIYSRHKSLYSDSYCV